MVFYQGNRISLRRTALLFGDIVCILGSIFLSAILRLGFRDGLAFITEQHMFAVSGSVLIFLVVFYASGMYERQSLTRKDGSYFLPLLSVAIGLVITIVVFYARYHLGIGRGVLTLACVFMFIGTWAMRYAYRMAVGYGLLSKKALVVGDGEELENVIKLVQRTADSGYKISGCATVRRMPAGSFVAGVPVVGPVEKLRECSEAFEIEVIIVATSMAREPTLLRMLRPLRWSGVEVMDYVALHEMIAQEIPINHINDEWLMNAAMNSSVIHIRQIKRIMDVATSIVGLVLSFPICLIAAVAIKLDSPGPLLFRQRRSGRDGRVYTLMKFRSMRQDAESKSGAVWAGKRDSRVTRVGSFLRKWRVDEVPQLINVLRGEMSLVGPRPHQQREVEKYREYHRRLLTVKPGLTGMAQTSGRSDLPFTDEYRLDIFYIENWSLRLDIALCFKTIRSVLARRKN